MKHFIRLAVFLLGFALLVILADCTLIQTDTFVALTLSEYVQVSGALSAIPAMLGELEARVAALEAMCGAPVAFNSTIPGTGTGPSGEEG